MQTHMTKLIVAFRNPVKRLKITGDGDCGKVGLESLKHTGVWVLFINLLNTKVNFS
jgi:hypothetical protein